jgi:hypothetical protein
VTTLTASNCWAGQQEIAQKIKAVAAQPLHAADHAHNILILRDNIVFEPVRDAALSWTNAAADREGCSCCNR